MTPRVTSISPVLLVADVERAVGHYRDRLGFTCQRYGEPSSFASAQRDGSSILLTLCAQPERIVPNWRIVDQTWNVHVRVEEVDALYAELVDRGATIDYSLYDAPHGFREFGVQDPDGHDIAFGQPL